MHIVKLTAENIKRLTAVEIAPSGHVVHITGKNGAGKSSVLDAIWWALAGADNIQSKPVRKGSKKGMIELNLGELVVRRTFTEKSSYLSVTDARGFKAGGPQKILDKLIGQLSFDPTAFLREPAKRQLETLQRLSGVDTAEIEQTITELFAQRADANREVKRLQVERDAIVVDPDAPEAEVSADDLLDELRRRTNVNRDNAEREAGFNALKQQGERRAERVVELQREVEQQKALLAHAEQALKEESEALTRHQQAQDNEQRYLAKLSDENLEEIDAQLRTLEALNAAARRRQLHAAASERLTAAAAAQDKLQGQLERAREQRAQMIAEAKMPVGGLGFDVDGVTYNELPLEQASQAEQLRVSMAMAMAMNPELRVIRITDASLMDRDSMAIVTDMAEKNDYQVWLEEVAEDAGEVGVHIVDGVVAAVDGVAQESASD